jgi:hypothetical protein
MEEFLAEGPEELFVPTHGNGELKYAQFLGTLPLLRLGSAICFRLRSTCQYSCQHFFLSLTLCLDLCDFLGPSYTPLYKSYLQKVSHNSRLGLVLYYLALRYYKPQILFS